MGFLFLEDNEGDETERDIYRPKMGLKRAKKSPGTSQIAN